MTILNPTASSWSKIMQGASIASSGTHETDWPVCCWNLCPQDTPSFQLRQKALVTEMATISPTS